MSIKTETKLLDPHWRAFAKDVEAQGLTDEPWNLSGHVSFMAGAAAMWRIVTDCLVAERHIPGTVADAMQLLENELRETINANI